MKYNVQAEYKTLSASTTVEADSEALARATAIPGIMRAISRKYPDVNPEDVAVAIQEIQEPPVE